ncbi:MerR family transcriptional regulator [uncultured Ruegeria sp.]|uniref:MerR family transcriptional regulator n=1 Tax=uncultured Ruegeria sp. TaxID=259304 RepID=UPI00260409A4|nr:MerR family transcriptional regulator [uncultured Ruegeria sp.]
METICYYEREGIVSKPARAQNNRRLYSASGVGRLRFLKKCHDLDLPLSDAKTDNDGRHLSLASGLKLRVRDLDKSRQTKVCGTVTDSSS